MDFFWPLPQSWLIWPRLTKIEKKNYRLSLLVGKSQNMGNSHHMGNGENTNLLISRVLCNGFLFWRQFWNQYFMLIILSIKLTIFKVQIKKLIFSLLTPWPINFKRPVHTLIFIETKNFFYQSDQGPQRLLCGLGH